MTGYTQGSTPSGEMAQIREAFARAAAAIKAWPNTTEAWQAANELSDLAGQLRGEAAEFRGYLAAYLLDYHNVTTTEIASFMGVSRARASQMITKARKRGNPVTEPLSLPEQPHVALAVITSDRGVLIAKRVDGIPPYTFLGGEILDGETSGDALRRRVQAEAGLPVTSVHFIGRRIHPKTSRVMVYGHVEVGPGEPQLGDPDDLSEVRWVSVDETRELMPDMYGPVRQYLDELARI
ncbi:MAG: hydrolase [Streptosporangiaceae bacterium]|nr:hydrolase [Streptosporangiaceae bacterium]